MKAEHEVEAIAEPLDMYLCTYLHIMEYVHEHTYISLSIFN